MIIVHKSGLNAQEREKIMKPYMANNSHLRDYPQLRDRINEYLEENTPMIVDAVNLLDKTNQTSA